MPTTATGTVEMLLKVPSPRCPESPTPQHCTVPSPSSAHVCASPVTTLVAVVRPLTVTGTEELVRFPSPLPSCPERSEEHTSELQSRSDLVCRLLLEKKKTRRTGGRTKRSRGWRPPLRQDNPQSSS